MAAESKASGAGGKDIQRGSGVLIEGERHGQHAELAQPGYGLPVLRPARVLPGVVNQHRCAGAHRMEARAGELDSELDAERGEASVAKLSMVNFSAAGAQRTGPESIPPEFNSTGVQLHRRCSVKQARRHLTTPCCDVRDI